MGTVTAKELHQETKAILDQVEKAEPLIITRNGRPVGRLEPVSHSEPPKWDEIMHEVWEARKRIPPEKRTANLVLQERARRRR